MSMAIIEPIEKSPIMFTSALKSSMWKGNDNHVQVNPLLSPLTPSPLDASFLLTYALHYEVKVMRKVWNFFNENRILKKTERTNNQIARSMFASKTKRKVFVALHKHYLAHFGHKFAKMQA
jgi:hypothetical protein